MLPYLLLEIDLDRKQVEYAVELAERLLTKLKNAD
jgi:hypothetical protein